MGCGDESLERRLLELEKFVSGLTGNTIDKFIEGGSVVGETLVLNLAPNGTVNIPLVGVERAIDFNNLSGLQKEALIGCIRGPLVDDAFGVPIGYLLDI